MSNLNKTLNKVKRALNAKGMMPLINTEQFYGDEGKAITKYVLHDSSPGYRNKNAIAVVYNKVDLLKKLIEILKVGDSNG